MRKASAYVVACCLGIALIGGLRRARQIEAPQSARHRQR